VDLGLQQRVAIVTGASRGIGRASAEALLSEGAKVVAVARDYALLQELESNYPGRVTTAAVDLTTDEGCVQAVETAMRAFGTVDILVNCAGDATMGNVLTLDRSQIDSALALKFHGYLALAQRVAPIMRSAGWGRIVNIAGGSGSSPDADNLAVSLANITVHNLTRALSDELAADNVLVNLISPGPVLTDRLRSMFSERAEATGQDVEQVIAEFADALPAKRAAHPSEIAQAVCFLASEACSYVYGSVLYMDGGARRATP
jgi:NAD(P)-dependent dehydrogenase (short-subunit alcohol dehydrogenase family)